MKSTSSRFQLQPSAFNHPEPIGDGIALRVNNIPFCSLAIREIGFGRTIAEQLCHITRRLIGLWAMSGMRADLQIPIAP